MATLVVQNIEIYNMVGGLVFSQEYLSNGGTEEINISSLDAGIYVIKATNDNIIATEQLIIE